MVEAGMLFAEVEELVASLGLGAGEEGREWDAPYAAPRERKEEVDVRIVRMGANGCGIGFWEARAGEGVEGADGEGVDEEVKEVVSNEGWSALGWSFVASAALTVRLSSLLAPHTKPGPY